MSRSICITDKTSPYAGKEVCELTFCTIPFAVVKQKKQKKDLLISSKQLNCPGAMTYGERLMNDTL